jgi:hypothetical protein
MERFKAALDNHVDLLDQSSVLAFGFVTFDFNDPFIVLTALHWVALSDSLDAAMYLVACGADVNVQTAYFKEIPYMSRSKSATRVSSGS